MMESHKGSSNYIGIWNEVGKLFPPCYRRVLVEDESPSGRAAVFCLVSETSLK
ncbi:unnamed protein product [Arabidopsis halleri]